MYLVRDDKIRAICRNRQPEEPHLVVFREASDLDLLSPGKLVRRPFQGIGTAVFVPAATVVGLPVGFYRAIVNFIESFQEQHQVFSCVPSVKQNPVEG